MNNPSIHTEDYEFTFRLGEMGTETLYDDPIVEFIRAQLEELLKYVILTKEGEEVKPDGFKLTIEGNDKEYQIFRN